MTITPFTIALPQDEIQDLKERLAMTRWPSVVAPGYGRGQADHLVRDLADQWLNRFDWRKAEAALNAYPQFLAEIDGQTIHFVHVKSGKEGAIPLLLVHGWPSNFSEFFDLVPFLTDPENNGAPDGQAFDLVIPSIPGFGFSGQVTEPGWDAARVARAFDSLMKVLGYTRYGFHGGDAGALVGRELGALAPDGLVGVHLQHIFAFPNGTEGEMEALTPFEREGFAHLEKFQKYAGFNDIQQKRPQTLGYGLVDSPAGLLAWHAELHFGFEGEGEAFVDRERYLTNAAVYWFTRTAGSAANFYFENAQTGAGYRETDNPTPTGVSVFPSDFRSVRSFAERANNIVHWSEMERGGHFPAIEAPDLLADDLRTFYARLA
ncbi:epoxide hydrolase family protein [Pelagibacterium xiamenense]|uniref:epoxide hydrolase family protein n=1 Tax=Pelagibacterium xiamenense TaxID=2901140 RepID=UPI001E46519E|nr:epoxide hydrolase family protein [Pelagibacterium xiamenense]MCD7059754.1 epoxide hydrolase [Pelagibacterium xiamenense]